MIPALRIEQRPDRTVEHAQVAPRLRVVLAQSAQWASTDLTSSDELQAVTYHAELRLGQPHDVHGFSPKRAHPCNAQVFGKSPTLTLQGRNDG